MATILKPSAEYNQRAAIIKGLRAGLSNENNSVLWIPKINIYDDCGKIYGFRTVQRRFQYASEEERTVSC